MKSLVHKLFYFSGFLLLLLAQFACAPFKTEYLAEVQVIDLGTLPGGGNSTARDINNGGYIVGSSDTSSDTSSGGDRRAFVIHGQGMQNLGTLPSGGASRAYGINESGYIVGSAVNSANILHGFVARYGVMRDLGAYPPEDDIGSSSQAYALNSSLLIAGKVDLVGGTWELNGTPTFPPFPPFTAVTDPGQFTPTIAYDINDNGQIAGTLLSFSAGFRKTSGSLEKLKPLSAADDDAFAINSQGLVVGQALLAPPVRYHAVLWSNPETVLDLGTLGGENSSARDINDRGTIVGYSETASGETKAFIWRPLLGMQSLGTLGGQNSKAFAINADGLIVGESETASGDVHATLWKVSIGTKLGNNLSN